MKGVDAPHQRLKSVVVQLELHSLVVQGTLVITDHLPLVCEVVVVVAGGDGGVAQENSCS